MKPLILTLSGGVLGNNEEGALESLKTGHSYSYKYEICSLISAAKELLRSWVSIFELQIRQFNPVSPEHLLCIHSQLGKGYEAKTAFFLSKGRKSKGVTYANS